MKVDKKVMDSWKVQKEHGDIDLIADQSKIHRNTISAAFKYSDMTQETFDAIKKYFETKKDKTLK